MYQGIIDLAYSAAVTNKIFEDLALAVSGLDKQSLWYIPELDKITGATLKFADVKCTSTPKVFPIPLLATAESSPTFNRIYALKSH